MGGRRESDTALLHGLSQCDSQCGSLDASIARQRRTIAQLHNCLQYARGGGRNDPSWSLQRVRSPRCLSLPLFFFFCPRFVRFCPTLSLTALFVGNWSRIYKPALIYRVLLMSSWWAVTRANGCNVGNFYSPQSWEGGKGESGVTSTQPNPLPMHWSVADSQKEGNEAWYTVACRSRLSIWSGGDPIVGIVRSGSRLVGADHIGRFSIKRGREGLAEILSEVGLAGNV